ncbi:sialin [Caerostris darwini]|uniref:Sialin n=1 Tax=Caerostris darwini TaxID=1538125 RepID=A0AAV4VJH9_9ARAC|nr:sialin [Caerostris darwini]
MHLNKKKTIRHSYSCSSRPDGQLARALGFPAWYTLTFLGFLGLLNIVGMDSAMYIIFHATVKSPLYSSFSPSPYCPERKDYNSSHFPKKTEFEWDSKSQRIILISYYYGHCLSPLPAGYISDMYGAKWLFGCSVLVNALLSILIPTSARSSSAFLAAIRALQGIAGGAAIASINTLIVKWMPIMERNSHYAIIYNGIPLGIVFSFAVDYFIAENDYLGGWTSLFYIEAAITVIWFLFWSILIFEAPEDHKFLSETEVEKIRLAQGKDVKNLTKLSGVPWRKIITSPAVWALAAANCGVRWSYETLFLELPIYMATVLNYPFMDNRLRSSMPFISGAVIGFTFGYLADNVRSKGRYSITTIRKTFNCFAFCVPGIGFIIFPFTGCDTNTLVFLSVLTVVFIEAKNAGSGIAHIDMCPELSATLYGIVRAIGGLFGSLAPLFAIFVTTYMDVKYHWKIVFFTTGLILFASALIFHFLGTAEEQDWLRRQKSSDERAEESDI